MHENNRIQGMKPGFDEVVRFCACQVIPGVEYLETRLHFITARGSHGVLLPRKNGENGKLAFQLYLFGLMAHDFARTGSRYRTRRYEGDQRYFHVEIAPDRRGDLSRIRKHLRIFHFGHDCQRRLAVFVNLERGDAVVPDQAGRSLHNVLDILGVIILPAEDNHVLDAAAYEKFAVVEESHVAGPKVAIVVGAIVYQPRTKLLQRPFRIIPVTQALTASGDPNFADMACSQRDVLFRIHDLNVKTREGSSATDNLRGAVDFGDLGRHASLPEREGTLVDGNDLAAAERNRQSIFGQPIGGIKALRLEPEGLKRLQKPRVSIRFYGFRAAQQHAERTEIATFQTLLGKPAGAQTISVSEAGGCRCAGPIGLYSLEPQDRPLNEISGIEAVRRAAVEPAMKRRPD